MKLNLSSGYYVLAVSGGVDSMTLLDLTAQQPDLTVVVAHFDHGIRADSVLDRRLVKQAVANYNLPFYYAEAKLGPGASEDTARQARYKFLTNIKEQVGAEAVVTAHHQDDLLETAVLNLLRGSGRRGLTSLGDHLELKRPLLEYRKDELLAYARARHLKWREDSTNSDLRYRRNYIRSQILPKLSDAERQQLLTILENNRSLNQKIDQNLHQQLKEHGRDNLLDRKWFVSLPHGVAREVMAEWLRQSHLNYDRVTLERLVVAAKTARSDRHFDVNNGAQLTVGKNQLGLIWHSQVSTASNPIRHSV